MSRLPPPALDEGEQIHAILRPLFLEADAGERRLTALGPEPAPPRDWAELDALIEGLLARMRVDPRPKGKDAARATREVKRATHEVPTAVGGAPPPVPPTGQTARPATATGQAARPATATGQAARPAPPPVPPALAPELPPLPEPPRVPALAERPADELEAPPLPPPGPETRAARRPTTTLPVVPPDEVAGQIVPARPGNMPETKLLYDDIVNLSGMADRDGLVISLERLLLLSKLEDHVRAFVESNEVKLMSIYEAELKSFAKVPKRRPPTVENTMPRVFLRGEKVAAVLPLIDGKHTITEITRRSPLTVVETCSVLSQLKRAGLIDI